MYKKQIKCQKILCIAAIITCALTFLYALGIMTDLYDALYSTMRNPYDLTETDVPGSSLYYMMQDFNKALLRYSIGLILLAVGRLLALPPELKKIGLRIIALGLILYALVPVSLQVSGMIENQYVAEIQEIIDSANQNTEELRGTADRSDDSSIWSEFTEKIKIL